MKWANYSEITGEIIQVGSAPDSTTKDDFSHFPGLTQVNVPDFIDRLRHYYDFSTCSFVEKSSSPSEFHEWDWTLKQWIVNIALAESDVRFRRDRLLSASDWTQLPDVPVTTKDDWSVYRQALRDITDQAGFPFSIVWPTAPTQQ